jgi:hypothetical protein
MSLKADKKYSGVITPGSYFSYSVNGNLAFNIMIECEDGSCSFPLWLTEKNREKAIKTLVSLGADKDKLSSQTYLDMELSNTITGKEISFGTREDEYNGKVSVKISWIGKHTEENVAKGASNFFSGKSGNGPVTEEDPIDSSDIPF